MTDFGGAIKKSQDYEFAIIGVPFAEKSCHLKGASRGPQAIRTASTGKSMNAWTELGINLKDETILVDLGDVETTGHFQEVFTRIEKCIRGIIGAKAVPIILGGDHSISYPSFRAFSHQFASLDILHFDAHPDLYEELYGDRYSHACPFSRILEEGQVKNLVQVGIRASTGQQRTKALEYHVQTIWMKDLKEIPALEFSNPLYISFDLDALDPAYAPGVSHHEPGGLSTRQVIDIIHSLKARIVGLDVVELNPDRDGFGITAAAAVKIIKEVIGKIIFEASASKKEVS